MKLKNFVRGSLRITQTEHGRFQNYKAIDVTSGSGSYDIIAPCDVKVGSQRVDGLGNPFFEVFNNDFKIQFVHAKTTVSPGIYSQGSKIGTYRVREDKYPDHIHVALQQGGVWYNILEYMDRSIPLTLGYGFRSQKWKNWSTWGDRQLNIHNLTGSSKPTKMDYKLYEKDNNLYANITKGGFEGRIKVERLDGSQKGSYIENIYIGRPEGGTGGALVMDMDKIRYKVIFPGNHKTFDNREKKEKPNPTPKPINKKLEELKKKNEKLELEFRERLADLEKEAQEEYNELRGELTETEKKKQELEVKIKELEKEVEEMPIQIDGFDFESTQQFLENEAFQNAVLDEFENNQYVQNIVQRAEKQVKKYIHNSFLRGLVLYGIPLIVFYGLFTALAVYGANLEALSPGVSSLATGFGLLGQQLFGQLYGGEDQQFKLDDVTRIVESYDN